MSAVWRDPYCTALLGVSPRACAIPVIDPEPKTLNPPILPATRSSLESQSLPDKVVLCGLKTAGRGRPQGGCATIASTATQRCSLARE